MSSFIRRHQLALFLALTFTFSWYPWYTGLGPGLNTFGPSLAALLIVALSEGRSGLRALLRPFLRWRVAWGRWAVAIFGTAVLFLAGLIVHLILGGRPPPFLILRQELSLLPLFLLIVLLPWNGPVGEELGWRGFALTRLQADHGSLAASLVIGIVWGLWHLPTFFDPHGLLGTLTAQIGLVLLLPYVATTVANSIIMTWLYNRSGGSALIAGIVWHASTDFWGPVLLANGSLAAAQDGSGLPMVDPALYLTVAAILTLAAALLAVVTRGRLGRTESP